jgi:DNA-binding response OmpR family regulator
MSLSPASSGLSRMVIVETDPDIAHLLRLLLSEQGWTVAVAHGLDAVQAALVVGRPAFVLLSPSLPPASDQELCHTLKESRPDVRIAVVTRGRIEWHRCDIHRGPGE